MNKDKVYEIVASFTLPSWNEIPDVGLYLDQVTKYLNFYLMPFGMDVTPSMISNYVKLKIIPREGKKIYSRERIASLIFVAVSKTVLSMDQIRTCLAIREEICSPEKGYGSFVRFLQAALREKEEIADADETGEEGRALLSTITSAIAHKIRLDAYFREMQETE
ncbi:MAG: DUF1836 domain-containing protein [Solobacterium sp.]|nr:DUF1836 domain-containing protein [Solobacterium sp.]